MKTKNLLLLGVAIAGGYLLYKRYNQNKMNAADEKANLVAATDAQIKVATTLCEGAWMTKSATARYASEEAKNAAKDKFMETCIQDEANKAAANLPLGTKTK